MEVPQRNLNLLRAEIGRSLAPFLFLMVVKGLTKLVRQASKKNLLKGVKVGRNEIECCML